jgi:hypothetical protein
VKTGSKILTALSLSLLALMVYFLFCRKEYQHLSYFVPLAESFLHGRLDIEPRPWLNELVPRDGRYYVVYPPMPAVLLMPAAAVWGASLNQVWPSIILAALSVGMFYMAALRFFEDGRICALMALILGFGSGFFMTALVGSSWFFAHISAVFFLLIGLLLATGGRPRPFLAGAAFAGSFLSRLPLMMALPFFLYLLFRERPRGGPRNAVIFLLPVLGALVLLGWYDMARFESPFQLGYSLIPGVLSEPWYQKGIFHLSYLPRQLEVMFLAMPNFSARFPFFLPSYVGMALWLTTPALLLLFGVRRGDPHLKWFLGTALLVALPSLFHGTTGFAQYGYRFSLDYLVFLLLPLVPVFRRIGARWSSLAVSLCVAINVWTAFLYRVGVFRL